MSNEMQANVSVEKFEQRVQSLLDQTHQEMIRILGQDNRVWAIETGDGQVTDRLSIDPERFYTILEREIG